MNTVSLLRWQLDIASALLAEHLRELTDQECLWEPATPCRTVRPDAHGRWVADREEPAPAPSPVPTVAWLTWEIGYWWTLVYSHSFGSGALRREDVGWPGTAAATVTWLRLCQNRWTRALDCLDEREFDSGERGQWLMRGTKPFSYVVAWTNAELMKSAAEIGYVRNLYQARRTPLAKGA